MRSLANNLTIIHNKNLICMKDCADSLSYNNNSGIRHICSL